ncbi:MAG: KpsF/GutQ family sugar-phosphate isomerase [Kiritimatiellaeota bacterium]|nr:KpsF/GutQ family sugar-phosphate isomerase [Kiritimatiellota bacterium]
MMTSEQILFRAREVLDIEINGLARSRDALDGAFAEAVKRIIAALDNGGKIVVTGIGKSFLIAEKISATLASTGSTSVVLNPVQAMHGDLGIVTDRDILVALSYSGESDELVNLMPAVRRLGLPVIALTGNPRSSLAGFSDVVLLVDAGHEACPFKLAPTTSTTATLAVGDALAMVLLDARDFRQEDYARLHPAGAIGRALLLTVRDVMRSGDKVAVLKPGATVQDAVIAMTRAQSGCACMVDAAGVLLGIFTDGDLRRGILNDPDFLARPASGVMTANPKHVRENQLAAEVLKIFEVHKIDDLPVVDGEGRLAGCVDIQDLPRMKVF